ncbi:hypothetical protein SH1V18_15150 [Vallitalea longa]|uniref:Phosphoadenosine phosphosulphate reductase domain-containing protein n=1 Tax=Vallitalea longa TaxID=2936439 RepID=A0A9W5Y8C5_9FIRM|nr:phosphoadenosine phosphosulfate reductase family protein [Vallitalea longa]GKX29035.1 hypothetical protein SH1V18_15150 [Vallitalea longa]
MEGQQVINFDTGELQDELDYKVKTAIKRYKMFEPKEGYYLAFSGGKDSIVIKALADMAGVKYDAHYNITTVDPPELLRFIKKYHVDVKREKPSMTMWELIPYKLMPPTRIVRYCCSVLKEGGGKDRFVITGIRWAESIRRKNNREMIEFDRYGSQSKQTKKYRKLFLMNDNEGKRRMIESCAIKGKHILNPIIDWTNNDIWNFIHKYDIPYCKLYDQGFERLGCIGCPMAGEKGMMKEFKRWPHYKKMYLKAFNNMLKEREKRGLETNWKSAEEVMNWWIHNQ